MKLSPTVMQLVLSGCTNLSCHTLASRKKAQRTPPKTISLKTSRSKGVELCAEHALIVGNSTKVCAMHPRRMPLVTHRAPVQPHRRAFRLVTTRRTLTNSTRGRNLKKGQSFHETIDLDNEIQLNNLSETNHSCVFPFKIYIPNSIKALILWP